MGDHGNQPNIVPMVQQHHIKTKKRENIAKGDVSPDMIKRLQVSRAVIL